MTNPYYTAPTTPADFTVARASQIRREWSAIELAFDRINAGQIYDAAGGTANNLTANTPVPITAYDDRLMLRLKITTDNTGPATLNLNGLGVAQIVNHMGNPLAAGDLIAGSVETLFYVDGRFMIREVPALAGPAGDSAYQTALENGFVGSEAQWLDSLVGQAIPSDELLARTLDLFPQYPGTISPSTGWSGAAGSGFSSLPVDPVRTTAKPVCRLLVAPNQYFTDELVVGVFAAANNAGSFANLGLQKVICHFEGQSREIIAPSIYSFVDVNGVPRSYYGWWITLKAPGGVFGHANVYFEAVPADATMQSRVIGPHQFSPLAALHDVSLTVAPSLAEVAGSRYQSITAALTYCRNTARNNPLITITEAHPSGKYDIGYTGAAYQGQGYATVTATVPVVIGKAAYIGDYETIYQIGYDGVRYKGANITFDMQFASNFYHEIPTNRLHWFDGVTIMNSAGRYFMVRGKHLGSKPFARDGAIFTECAISHVANAVGTSPLTRGCSFTSTYDDLAVDCSCFIGNTVVDHTSEQFRNNLPALTIDGPAGATIELSGGNGEGSRTFTAKVSGATVGTFEVLASEAAYIANTNYTVANVVAWINTLAGWTGTILDNTRAAQWIGAIDSPLLGGAFPAKPCATPLTLYTALDLHPDLWANQNITENLVCFGNKCWNDNSQGIYISVPNTKDVLIANNAYHGLSSVYVAYFSQAQSNVIYAHNSVAEQTIVLAAETTYNPDARCAFLSNAARITWNTGVTDPNLVIRDNHMPTGTLNPAGSTGTTIGGDTATLFADAVNGDFSPSGLLLANLKAPTMPYDHVGAARTEMDAAGSLSVYGPMFPEVWNRIASAIDGVAAVNWIATADNLTFNPDASRHLYFLRGDNASRTGCNISAMHGWEGRRIEVFNRTAYTVTLAAGPTLGINNAPLEIGARNAAGVVRRAAFIFSGGAWHGN